MAIHICALFPGKVWEGTYEQIDREIYALLPDHDYWLYRDSWYWFISDSQYQYDDSRIVARKVLDPIILDPTGTYLGVGVGSDGVVSKGYC